MISDVGDRVRFMVHENYRFRPHYMTVRRWVDEGRIGRIRHVAISCRGSGLCEREGTVPFLIERQPYLKWFNRNLVFETMIHHLDVLRWWDRCAWSRRGWASLAEDCRARIPRPF